MKKAAASQTAVTLGTKRTCPKCALKFYDLNKPEIQCPKCGTEVDPNAELAFLKPSELKKAKPKATLRDDEEEVVVGTSEFESVDDLGDDDDDEGLDNLASGDAGDDDDA